MSVVRPNILLITVECWRGDHLSDLTPCLQRLGAESSVFEQAQVTAGWTLPSMMGLMSSVHASRHGGPPSALHTPRRRLLAECLLNAGYWTAAVTTNPACGGAAGFHRGFGSFTELRQEIPPHLALAARLRDNWEELSALGISPIDLDGLPAAGRVTECAIKWLDRQTSTEPFFIWLHYLEPHWPYLTPERPSTQDEIRAAWQDRQIFRTALRPARGRLDLGETGVRWINRYRESLTIVDKEIGRVVEQLRARQDWNRTMIIATGDHGEEFNEHGTWLHQWNQLHREGVQVPLIIRIPGSRPQRIGAPVSHLDVTPTLLDYAGLTQPEEMTGASFRSLLEGGEHSETPLYTEMLGHTGSSKYALAIRDGAWKYIHDVENPFHPRLFNVEQDPLEKNDVVRQFPDVHRRFEQVRLRHIVGVMNNLQTWRASTDGDADAAAREQLEALGYI